MQIAVKISLKDKQYFGKVKEKTGRKGKSSLVEQGAKDIFIQPSTTQYERGEVSEG